MGRIRKIGSAHCNYSQILYQFLTFTQNLKRSQIDTHCHYYYRNYNYQKSSYYYQEQSLQKEDKYTLLRVRVIELFTENKGRYGYRRIHALLKCENIIVSEKVIRRIMKEEQLVVKIKTNS